MPHLTPEELLDLLESADPIGASQSAQRTHLDGCAECRRQLEDAKNTIAAVAGDVVPEPSPMFWDHLSTQVRQAVSAEAAVPERWWSPWAWGRQRVLAPSWQSAAFAVAAVVIVLAAVVTLDREPRPSSPGAVATNSQVSVDAPLGEADEASLSLLADLAGGLSWEDATDAGLTMRAGTVESAMMELTAEERLELQRLLQKELSSPSGTQSS